MQTNQLISWISAHGRVATSQVFLNCFKLEISLRLFLLDESTLVLWLFLTSVPPAAVGSYFYRIYLAILRHAFLPKKEARTLNEVNFFFLTQLSLDPGKFGPLHIPRKVFSVNHLIRVWSWWLYWQGDICQCMQSVLLHLQFKKSPQQLFITTRWWKFKTSCHGKANQNRHQILESLWSHIRCLRYLRCIWGRKEKRPFPWIPDRSWMISGWKTSGSALYLTQSLKKACLIGKGTCLSKSG